MIRAFAIGVIILIVAHLLYLLLLQSTYWFVPLQSASLIKAAGFVLWSVPLVAAFVVSVLTPRRRLLLAILLAAPAALFVGVTNFAFEAVGHSVDFPGITGAAMVTALSIPFILLLCSVGGFAGRWFKERHGA